MANLTGASSTVSVAMCTYNGAQYLPCQLESIASQTRTPNELIIRDDASSDTTMEVIEDFAANSAISVRLTRNRTRLGVTANFEAAISDASCDYIALCDQDDIWDPSKLHILTALLDAEPDVAGAVADARCIRSDGKQLRGTVWQRNRFSAIERHAMAASRDIAPLLRGNVIPGACTMFRVTYRNLLLPFSTYSHYDYWIALLLQAVGRLAYLDVPLQSYRLHSRNAIGMPSGLAGLRLVRAKNSKSAKADAYQFANDFLTRLASNECHLDERSNSLVLDWTRHALFRATLPERFSARVLPVLHAAFNGRYKRHTRNANFGYSRGTVSWLYDIVFG